MARRPRKQPDIIRPELPAAAPPPRFVMQRMEDGVSQRAVRWRSRRDGERDQAMADFFGVGPELPVTTNIRTVESLLGEVLASMKLEEEELSAELLAEAWLKAVGPALSSLSQLVSVAHHSACIRVAHPAARYELTRLRPRVIEALNQTLGDGSVTKLKIIA